MDFETQRQTGAFFTPPDAVRALVAWAVQKPTDRMLDPSCGDGRFLALHDRCVGVEQNPESSETARARAPWALIDEGDFFAWAANTKERFECAVGNPPFIRYQRFTGETRQRALDLCEKLGAQFSALTSSWAPFLVATASLLKRGGRMAFVVPAEIGHAPYARPVLEYFAAHFSRVHVTAVRSKLFPDLSEDVWLLYAEGFGGSTTEFELARRDSFEFATRPPRCDARVSLVEWRNWNGRLRPFLLKHDVLSLYADIASSQDSYRLGSVAKVGIGYVTGANDFFHLRPSQAAELGIPRRFLAPSVRNGRMLPARQLTPEIVSEWIQRDEPIYLLRLRANQEPPDPVMRYLRTRAGMAAQRTYKCRNRSPWYSVPDVTVPDAFLAYMSGGLPALVANRASCVGTNSVHTVHLSDHITIDEVQESWGGPVTELSCELEGHPLGGGMLKVEPGEAKRIVLTKRQRLGRSDRQEIETAVHVMRQWRHVGV